MCANGEETPYRRGGGQGGTPRERDIGEGPCYGGHVAQQDQESLGQKMEGQQQCGVFYG